MSQKGEGFPESVCPALWRLNSLRRMPVAFGALESADDFSKRNFRGRWRPAHGRLQPREEVRRLKDQGAPSLSSPICGAALLPG